MEAKSKGSLSTMEQKEPSKLRNNEAIIIKPEGKGRAVVIFSKAHYQSMIMLPLEQGV